MKWGLAPGAVGEDQPGGRRPGSGPDSSLISSVTKQVSFQLWVLVSHLENRMLSQELLRAHPALTVHGSVVCPAKKHFPGPHPRSLVGVAGAHLPSQRIRRQCVTPPVRVHVSWVQLCKGGAKYGEHQWEHLMIGRKRVVAWALRKSGDWDRVKSQVHRSPRWGMAGEAGGE